jgi:hypothetical protein
MANSQLIIEDVIIKGEMPLYESFNLEYGYATTVLNYNYRRRDYDEHGNKFDRLPSDCFNYHNYKVL